LGRPPAGGVTGMAGSTPAGGQGDDDACKKDEENSHAAIPD